jgi:thioester reductase-like protein
VISSEVFTRLRRERPDADAFIRRKLVAIAGELTQKGVGFSDEDLRMLCENVNIIIHCAAVVDFNEVFQLISTSSCPPDAHLLLICVTQ